MSTSQHRTTIDRTRTIAGPGPDSGPATADTTPAPAVASRAKDAAICAAIFAGAGIAWFGWGQLGGRFAGVLIAASIAGSLLLLVSILILVRTPGRPTLSVDPTVRRTYNLALVGEVAAIVIAAALLNRGGLPEYLPAATLAIVGVHFVPLARAFRLPIVGYAAWACLAVSGLAVIAGASGWLPAPTVAGLGGGAALLTCAVALQGRVRRG